MGENMLKKILLIINPLTLFLILNFLSNSSSYDEFENLERLNYVNIGSSHAARAFNYMGYSNSINLGFGSQRMYYGLELLEAIERSLDGNSTVIIPISIFSFCGAYDGPKQRYVGFLDRDQLGMNYIEEIYHMHFPFVGIDKNERRVYGQLEIGINYLDRKFSDDGLEIAQRHLNDSYECGIIDQSILEKTRQFIERNSDKRIILIITPYYYTYWETILLEQVVADSVYSTIYSLVNDFSIEFYDYSSDYRFLSSEIYFRDSNHLNSKGATEFTRVFFEDIS